jgi:hypothetical protein
MPMMVETRQAKIKHDKEQTKTGINCQEVMMWAVPVYSIMLL